MQENLNEEVHYGFLEVISIIFINKTHPSESLKRENYWECVPKTVALLGLNIKDSV